jgi:hypothetical protein
MIRPLLALFVLSAAAYGNGCFVSTTGVLPQAVQNVATTYTITTVGCTAPYQLLEVATGSLPPGLTLSSSGANITLSGTPSTAGTYAFSIRAVDQFYSKPAESFVIKVNPPPRITTPALASSVSGVAYTDTVRAVGGVAPYSFSVVQGSLPSGLTLNASTGAITGTTPATGSVFRIRVTDSSTPPVTAESPFTIYVGTTRITTTATPPVGSTGTAYSFDVDSTGTGNCFAIALGSLPPGLSINSSTGIISGTPATAGRYDFTVRCASTTSDWRSYQILINSAGTVSNAPRNAEYLAPYDHVFAVNGGVEPYTFSVTSGVLLSGLSLDAASGALYGKLNVTVEPSNPFTITAVDASGRSYSQSFTISRVDSLSSTEGAGPPVTRAGVTGNASPYSVFNGQGPYLFRFLGGPGRQEINLNSSTGAVTFNFPSPGTYQPVVLATDALGGSYIFSFGINYVIVGDLGIATQALPNGNSAGSYNTQVTATNGNFTPLTWSVSSGSLPPGLTLAASTGVISGTLPSLSSSATYTFGITVSDSASQTASRTFKIGVGSGGYVSTVTVPNGTVQQSYSTTIQSSGLASPIWSSSGTLPPGLNFNSGGNLTGTPTTAGTYTFTAIVGDVFTVDSKEFTIVISSALGVSASPSSPLEMTKGTQSLVTLTITGGRAPYNLTAANGSLPDGLYFTQTAPYQIRGIPEAVANSTFTISVTDADGRNAQLPYTMNVRAPVTISDSSLLNPTRTVSYNQTLTGAGGQAPYTFAVTSGSLPNGLTLSSAGAITGTPSINNTFNFTVTITDTNGRTGTKAFTVNVYDPIVDTTSTALPNGTLYSNYSTNLTTTGGAPTKTFSISSNDLPPLFAINATTGQIANLPLVAGTYNFDVAIADSEGRTGSKSHSIVIGPQIAITTTTLPNGTTGVAYNQPVATSGGSTPLSFAVTSGALPNGLSLSTTPTSLSITGTPTVANTFNFTITVTDTWGSTASQAYIVIISNPLTISPATLPNGTTGVSYSQSITSGGGRAPVTFSATGTLPTGVTLSSGGLLSGTPTAANTFNFSVTATDADLRTATQAYAVIIADPLTITTASLPNGTVGSSYNQTVLTSGGRSPVTFSATGLPTGLSIGATTGAITGTPGAAGPFTVNITATDADNRTATKSIPLTIVNALIVDPSSIPNGTAGTAYSVTFTSPNASGAVTWAIVAGALPGGITLNTGTGVLSGTPSQLGSFTFTVGGTVGTSQSGQRSYTMSVAQGLTINPSSLPEGVSGTAYSQTLTAASNVGAVAWSISSGTLPPGLTLNSTTGVISGTPGTANAYTFTVRANDTAGQQTEQIYTLNIVNPLTIIPITLPNGTATIPYSRTLTLTSAQGTVTWSILTGLLPNGLSLNASSGVLSGTPTTAGPYTFTVRAIDGNGNVATRDYTLTINPAINIDPPALPSGTVSFAYNQTLTMVNAIGAVNWTLSGGSLPAGLVLGQTSGTITGTPTVAGSSTFTISASDSQNQQTSRQYTLLINAPVSIDPATLPNGTVNTLYSQTLSMVNANGPVTWSIATGTLPTGLALGATTGVLSGTPTTAGTFNFTVQASDGRVVQRAYAVTINPALSISPATLPNGIVSAPYNQTLTLVNAIGAATWSVTAGSLPTGLTLGASTGVLSGTPTASGPFTFTVLGTDSQNQQSTRQYSITIRQPVSIDPPTVSNGVIGAPYTASLTMVNGLGSVAWSVESGALPTGLALNASSGVLSGTPSAAGTFTFGMLAVDSQGQQARRTYTVIVDTAIVVTTVSLPDGVVNELYPGATLTAAGGTGTYTWSIASGALPSGVTLTAATGVIASTPAAVGTSVFRVCATDTRGNRGCKDLAITVAEALTILTITLGEATQGQAFVVVLGATGGQAPYTWSLVGTSLPAGLTLDPAGRITGTPSAGQGTYPQVIQVTDARGRTARRTVNLSIAGPPTPALSLGPDSLPNGTVNEPYSATMTASGGTPGYSFRLTQGALPPGLTLAGPAISGRPTTAGTYRFTITLFDAEDHASGLQYTVVINPALIPLSLSPASVPNALINQAYTVQFNATGGKAPYTFSVTGNLPPGTAFNSAGTLAGTPSQGGTFSFNVKVTDADGKSVDRGYSVAVTGSLVISQTTLPEGTVGKPYAAAFSATGGRSPLTWSSTGNLPAGLSLDAASGELRGTPSAPGSFEFTIIVTDAQRLTAQANFSIRIYPKLELPSGPQDTLLPSNQLFSFQFPTMGGKAPITFGVTDGALPAGVILTPGGALTGTPTVFGTFTFTVTATDSLGNLTSRDVTLRIAPPLLITTQSLPGGTVQTTYTASLATSGGVPPLGQWSVSAGTLPPGLTLSGAGQITGTPTTAGTFTFTVRINDASQVTPPTRQFTIEIVLPPVPPLTVSGLPPQIDPRQQTPLTLQIARPFPVDLTGELIMTFVPNAVNSGDDPDVRFSSGQRTVRFRIPAGQTAGVFDVNPLLVLSGTVAGTIRIRTTTTPASETPIPEQVIVIPRVKPVITSVTPRLGTDSFLLEIVGFSNTREISSGTFRLNPVAGTTLQTTELNVNLTQVFNTWFQSQASLTEQGGKFQLTMPFTVTGLLADIESVTLTLTNSVGASDPFTVRLR